MIFVSSLRKSYVCQKHRCRCVSLNKNGLLRNTSPLHKFRVYIALAYSLQMLDKSKTTYIICLRTLIGHQSSLGFRRSTTSSCSFRRTRDLWRSTTTPNSPSHTIIVLCRLHCFRCWPTCRLWLEHLPSRPST